MIVKHCIQHYANVRYCGISRLGYVPSNVIEESPSSCALELTECRITLNIANNCCTPMYRLYDYRENANVLLALWSTFYLISRDHYTPL